MTNHNEPKQPAPDKEPTPEQQARQLARVNKFSSMTNKEKRQHLKRLRKKARKCRTAFNHYQECMIVNLAVEERRMTAKRPQDEANEAKQANRVAYAKAEQAIRQGKIHAMFKEQTDNGNLRNRMKG